MAVSITQVSRYTTAGNVFTNVTKPADMVAMRHTTGVPIGGVDVGATIGEAMMTYTPTIATVDIEQAFGGVAPRMTGETATLKFIAAEATYQNIKLAMQQGTYTTDAGHYYLTAGGKTGVTTDCVAVMSVNADQALYTWICIYQAVSMAGVALSMKKGTTRQISITLTALPDSNRSAGDQLFQYGEEAW